MRPICWVSQCTAQSLYLSRIFCDLSAVQGIGALSFPPKPYIHLLICFLLLSLNSNFLFFSHLVHGELIFLVYDVPLNMPLQTSALTQSPSISMVVKPNGHNWLYLLHIQISYEWVFVYTWYSVDSQHCQVRNSPAQKALLRCVAFDSMKSLLFSFSREPRWDISSASDFLLNQFILYWLITW